MYESEPSSDLSDISQGSEAADILGVPQAIKGFDKPDFCYVLSQYICNFRILGKSQYVGFATISKNQQYLLYASLIS